MRARARSTASDDAGEVKGLEQVVDGVHVEGADGVLIVSGGEDELRQGRGVRFRRRRLGAALTRLRSMSR